MKFKRPYGTYYYEGTRSTLFVSQGAAKTEEGAKEAVGVKLIREQYIKGVIVEKETGVRIWTFRRTASGLRMSMGAGSEDE
jgi:hypothetical protein